MLTLDQSDHSPQEVFQDFKIAKALSHNLVGFLHRQSFYSIFKSLTNEGPILYSDCEHVVACFIHSQALIFLTSARYENFYMKYIVH